MARSDLKWRSHAWVIAVILGRMIVLSVVYGWLCPSMISSRSNAWVIVGIGLALLVAAELIFMLSCVRWSDLRRGFVAKKEKTRRSRSPR